MDAFAQATGGAAPAANPMMATLLMLLQLAPILVIMYLLLIRPQQQRQKQAEKMLKALKKGDKVLTSGGIYGTVIGVDDTKAVLRVADEIKIEFAKSAIVSVLSTENS
jgi:preprotein translocase subunit YajC